MNYKQFIKKINIEKATLGAEATIPKQLKAKAFFHEKVKEIAKKIE